MALWRSVFVLGVLGCGNPQLSSAPIATGRPVASAKAIQSTSALSPVEAAPPSPSPPLAKLRARIVHLSISDPEPRLLALGVRAAEPALQKCVEGAPTGWLVLEDGVIGKAGKLESFKAEATGITTEVSSCMQDVLRAVLVEHPPAKPARFSLWVSIAAPEPEGLDAINRFEELLRSEAGRCQALLDMECPANKICEAPRRRAIACPELFGLPAQPELKDAERRVDLGVSGGKTGQGSERVLLYVAKGQCAALKIVAAVGSDPASEARETVDIPCSAFEKTAKIVQTRVLSKRPRGNENVSHAVTKTVALWDARTKSGIPVVTELTWAGRDPADESFTAAANEAGQAIAGRGVLRLGRFEP